MIPEDSIIEWRQHAPWKSQDMIEQDLVISRALVSLYQNPFLSKKIAFRGGTAFNKLYLESAARYSEDIDLVQICDEPIGELLSAIRSSLDPWLGKARWSQSGWLTKSTYRFTSHEGFKLRLKVEINTVESFCILPFQQKNFEVNSSWFSGVTKITTFSLEELMATKLRALYQRMKGRDLFDLWIAFDQNQFDCTEVARILSEYNLFQGAPILRAQFEENLWRKLQNSAFLSDTIPLVRDDIDWDPQSAYEFVMEKLIALLPGESWLGNITKT